jgi:hypothetical protein
MRLVQNGKAVFRFRKLAAMPFRFTIEAASQMFPFVLLSSLLLILPGLWRAMLGGAISSNWEGFIYTLIMGGVFACQAAVFSLTLAVAVGSSLPDGSSGAQSRFADMKALVEKVWPQFFGMLAGLVTFSFLFAVVTAIPFQSALTELTSTGNPASAIRTFVWHVVLEIINPWFWLFGFVSGLYFRSAAKRAIVIFESVLDALDLRVEGAPSLTHVVDKNRKLFASLVSVPHFLFGLAYALISSLLRDTGISGLITLTTDFSGGSIFPLAASFGLNVMLAVLFSLVAGFIAVIWLAAAQTAGIVDNAIVAEAGFATAAKKAARAEARPAQESRTLVGSSPVFRRPGPKL